VRIGHLSQVGSFVTDRCESAAIRRICGEAQVDLLEADLREADLHEAVQMRPVSDSA
jgi:hypothetical protein